MLAHKGQDARASVLRVDRYDPLGNLRAPSSDTVSSAGQ
jgi:hypothetical protein